VGAAKNWYAVIRERGENWDATLSLRQQIKWNEHAAFMNALADDEFILIGGPLGDGKETLLIVAAANEEEIIARLADDPWVSLRLLQVAKIERWEILLGEARANSIGRG
jgi:uncharacterized protein YciI